jgi:hypothetical protein
VAALAQGGAEERERAYATIEGAVRAAPASSDSGKGQAIALAVACVRPLVESVLCAPASKVGEAEYRRAAVLLYEMCKVDMVAVVAETYRKDDEGVILWIKTYTAPDTVFAAMVAKDPRAWTRDDAITAAVHSVQWGVTCAVGCTAVFAEAGLDEMEFIGAWMVDCPFHGANPQPQDRYLPLGLLCLDLVRSETDELPEGVIAGAGMAVYYTAAFNRPVAKGVYDAGFLEVFSATMQRYSPMERIGQRDLIPTGMLAAFHDVVESVQALGVEVVQPLLDVGAVDIAISNLTAYQMLNKPEATSICAMWWGGLWTLEVLLGSAQAKLIVAKLRSAGVDSFRYLLDNPRVQFASLGMETGAN